MGSTVSERAGERNDWHMFKERLIHDRELGFWLDTSRLGYDDAYLNRMEPRVQSAFDAMEQLEAGAIANPEENRMVGHYWLRSPERAPSVEIKHAITATLSKIRNFAAAIHSGAIAPKAGGRFTHVLVIGIGGSALGPQFVYQALGSATDSMKLSFFDNTDPDGMNRVLYELRDPESTLVIVTSKSGGTKETRNGQYVAKAAFQKAGLDFRRHFVAITGEGSELDATAITEGWLERFPMWDWVGGRTSEFSAVGLLPLALQGVDIEQVLRGAAAMDTLTRSRQTRSNPAAMLALSWYHCGCGKGNKDMVVLPYKDRLELFSKYLQQLVMESLGKELDRNGEVVHQGLAVYGNKGSTDQHAYVQQLREGVHNFFAVFIEVLRDRARQTKGAGSCAAFSAETLEVEPGITSGDYLTGFYLGTRAALTENKRESITVGVSEVSPHSVGMLIALFERAVGLYASLVNVNAYHQPGVEAGKKAAAAVLKLQERVMKFLSADKGQGTAEEIAKALGEAEHTETVFHILRHLAENERLAVMRGVTVFEDSYRMK